MKKLVSVILVFLVCILSSQIIFAEEASQTVKDLATTKLAAYGSDPVIVASVKEQNAMDKSLAAIQDADKKWQETAGVDAVMASLIDSTCGKHLKEILESEAYFAEIFVMDNKGANVAMTGKTSDYWQGDEAKFTKSYAGGAGAVFVDEVEFDDSSQAYLVQISVPVMDEGKAIGAITFGIDVDKVE
jgi:hypothetical protein